VSKRKLSREARNRIELGSDMVAAILQQGAVPAILIGMKQGTVEPMVDYPIASKLSRKEIAHVIKRLNMMLNGPKDNNN